MISYSIYAFYLIFSFLSLKGVGEIPHLMNAESVLIFTQSSVFIPLYVYSIVAFILFIIFLNTFRSILEGFHDKAISLASSLLSFGSKLLLAVVLFGSLLIFVLDTNNNLFSFFFYLVVGLGASGFISSILGLSISSFALSRVCNKPLISLTVILYLIPLIGLAVS